MLLGFDRPFVCVLCISDLLLDLIFNSESEFRDFFLKLEICSTIDLRDSSSVLKGMYSSLWV